MALNLTTIKKLNPTHLTIIKKAQIWGHILTNHSTNAYSTYTPIKDPQFHLNPGDQLEILGFERAALKVRNSRGQEFIVHSSDISRFLAL